MAGDIDYPQGCLPIENTTNVSQQIERLRKLSGCLYEFENSDGDRSPSRFRTLFAHLSQSCFLDQSNIDFRILLSNCLASILRIFCPEYPTVDVVGLKDSYIHIFRSLKGLGESTTDSPKFKQYYQLLETVHHDEFLKPLSEMKDHDEREATRVNRTLLKEILIIPTGKGWNSNVRRAANKQQRERSNASESPDGEEDDDEDEDIIDQVEKYLIEIAVRAIGQMDSVPNEVLDVLFYHIVNPQRTNFKEARSMAESIIKACLDRPNENQLEDSIQKVMTSAAKEGHLPDEFELTGSSDRTKYFDALRYLHYISYSFVSNAIQELNFWLQSENETYREQAVKIVGMLTRDTHCQLGMDKSDATWNSFLHASTDVCEAVRREFVEQSKFILVSNHSHLRGHVINGLLRLAGDSSDEVRIDLINAVSTVAKSKLEAISDRLLKMCADRMRDKKPRVREHAIKVLMDLYSHVMTSRPLVFYTKDGSVPSKQVNELSSPYTDSEKECVKFIPNYVFNLYRHIQRNPLFHDSRYTIERYLQKSFAPYDVDAQKRVEVLTSLYRGLDESPRMMFADVINRSSQIRRALMGILSQVTNSKNMTPEDAAHLKGRIRRLCQIFPEPAALERIMKVFVNQTAESEETFSLVKKLVADSNTTEENIQYAINLKNIMDKKITTKPSQIILRHFIDRSSPLSFDTLFAKELVKQVTKTVTSKIDKVNWAQSCFEKDLNLLKLFTEYYAHIFADENIVKTIQSGMLMSEEPVAVEAAIHALSRVFANSGFKLKMEDETNRKQKWFLSLVKELKDLIAREEPELRRSCKLATRLLGNLLGKEKALEFFDTTIDALVGRLNIGTSGVANAFQVLAEIFRASPSHYFSKIIDVIESDRIGYQVMTSSEYSDDDPIEFSELLHMDKQPWPRYTMAKVYAAKFAAKVLSTFPLLTSSDEKRQMEKAAQKFLDLLCEILEKKGELGDKQCDVEKARLRCTASACLLKLASVLAYRPKFHTRLFKDMCYMITDEAYCVRLHYAIHVKKGLNRKLPIEFAACYGLINLGAIEEDGENKLEGFKAICMNQAQQVFTERSEEKADMMKLEGAQRAVFCAETVVAYVVWLLANYHKFDCVEDNADKNDSEEVLERKVANVNLLAELQEPLWKVIESLKTGRCNMQKVWKVLEKLKTCGDKTMRADGKMSANQMREHNKKLWALCDLGIAMMLYRAKQQMQDQESREAGFNLQFFYVCNDRDKADPSNVYAPDILINDEKQRNGRVPKTPRVYQVSDIIAEFSPPPQSNESAASTSLKNISKRSAANTSSNKTRGGRTTKRRSGGAKNGDEDEETVVKASPAVKKTRSRRGPYDLPQEENDDEEVIPPPKRRGAPAASPVQSPSSSNGVSKVNASVSPVKKNSRVSNSRQKSNREADILDDSDKGEEEEMEKTNNDSLQNLIISPILGETSGRSRRSARTIAASATITASTPLVPAKPKSIKRKRTTEVLEEAIEKEESEEEKEPVLESPSPKKRTSQRRAAKPSPPSVAEKTPSSIAKKSPVKANGHSPKKNKYGLPEEEDDEQDEQAPSTSRASLRSRTSARLSKK